ncbi:MAG: helix-turn-helix domain-containing protein [Ramlibacter sp.]|nr:helix-turn-helix domain-containing protein [Ramlibacter sp.]
MDLKTYLANAPGGGVVLAEKLKVAPAYLSQMVNGHRAISPERCVAIEQATEGKVTRRDLRPDDWLLIWPELDDRLGLPDSGHRTRSDDERAGA